MTIQHKPTAQNSLPRIAWLQPVRLPSETFADFASRFADALAELEAKHGPPNPDPPIEPAYASIKRHRRPR